MGDTKGNTVTTQGETTVPRVKPRAPHERDESADSQAADSPEIDRMGEIAHDSAAQGHEDTTKGQELDATYQRVRETETRSPRDKPGR
jgi:hypothetical protein